MEDETTRLHAEELGPRWAVGLVVGSLVAFALVGAARALKGCAFDSASICAKYVWLTLLRSDELPVLATVSTTALLAVLLVTSRSQLFRLQRPRRLAFGVLAAVPLFLIVGTSIAFGAAVLASWLACDFAPRDFVGGIPTALEDVMLSLSRGVLGGALVGIGSAWLLLPRRPSELLPARALIKRATALGIAIVASEIVLSFMGLKLWYMS